jgi:hypothetical protein
MAFQIKRWLVRLFGGSYWETGIDIKEQNDFAADTYVLNNSNKRKLVDQLDKES